MTRLILIPVASFQLEPPHVGCYGSWNSPAAKLGDFAPLAVGSLSSGGCVSKIEMRVSHAITVFGHFVI